MREIYQDIENGAGKNRKKFAVLIDPDATREEALLPLISQCNTAAVDYILVGGSHISNGYFEKCIETIRKNTSIPCIIFPGNSFQISRNAHAILLLSLISGRNPEMLIGQHVMAAPLLKSAGIEIIATGYILIDGGRTTSVSYMSNTTPIPSDKYAIAASTALAGEMLGLKVIYMDAGSGAHHPVSPELIREVKKQITIPLIVGGGIKTEEQALMASQAGADVIVVGNAAEKDLSVIARISKAIHAL